MTPSSCVWRTTPKKVAPRAVQNTEMKAPSASRDPRRSVQPRPRAGAKHHQAHSRRPGHRAGAGAQQAESVGELSQSPLGIHRCGRLLHRRGADDSWPRAVRGAVRHRSEDQARSYRRYRPRAVRSVDDSDRAEPHGRRRRVSPRQRVSDPGPRPTLHQAIRDAASAGGSSFGTERGAYVQRGVDRRVRRVHLRS
jgi:hypothetical protein